MKVKILFLLVITTVGCKSKPQDKRTHVNEGTQIIERKINEPNIHDSNKKSSNPITIQELFYQKQIEGGHLLALSNGKLKQQYERAMVFVPAGGQEQSAEIVVKSVNDKEIVLVNSESEIIYHLFCFDNGKDALITKYESRKEFKLIRYHSDSNMFTEEELTKYSLNNSDKIYDLEFEENSILFKNTGKKFTWYGNGFEEINSK